MDALVGGRIFTGREMLEDAAVLVEAGRIAAVVQSGEVPAHARRMALEGGLLAPGFIDLQVNGGGGVLLNDTPTVEGIAAIARTHRRWGVTGLLPTLITTDAATMGRALCAVRAAIAAGVQGVLGIHLEGPHLNPLRRGAHDARLMRPVTGGDLDLLSSLGTGRTLVTLAPEMVGDAAIRTLAGRGVTLSAGHTDASPRQLQAAVDAGLRGFTHLYNAMTPLGSRDPGVVGAALSEDRAWCGIIVDGVHVHPASVRIAWRAKPPGKLFLVSDAMPPLGSDVTAFTLAGQRVEVRDGCARTADGRLAGAIVAMAGAVRNAVRLVGVPLEEALRMAATYPAEFLGIAHERGRIAPGQAADLVLLDADLQVLATWIGGDLERVA